MEQHNLIFIAMPNYIDYPEIEDNFVKSPKAEYVNDKSSTERNTDYIFEGHSQRNSELDNEHKNNSSEDDDNNYYGLRDNIHNDSKLLILLSIGTLISLGILVNSMLA